jgi:hypothetical protein
MIGKIRSSAAAASLEAAADRGAAAAADEVDPGREKVAWDWVAFVQECA